MAFIIPNALKTAAGEKYENLDQSEPDSLDFEILGNAGRSGVLSGCEVTPLGTPGLAVQVSAGIVVLDGKPYPVNAATSFSLPTAPIDNRFDLVVVRVSGGIASLVAVQGNDETANPYFPDSVNVITTAFNEETNIDFSTDVVLAAIYRQGSSAITDSRITDRRVFQTSAIVDRGSTVPSSGYGNTGSIYYKDNVAQGTTASGVYVKNSLGSWIELGQNTGPQVPVGTVIAWLGRGSVPDGFLEANGQVVSRSLYNELFSVFGTTYGAGDGSSTFGLPNLNSKHLKGTTTANNAGTNTGSDTVTLSNTQLPAHTHSLAGHTHTVSHNHTMAHNHNVSVVSAGTHSHNVGVNGTTTTHNGHSHADGNYSGTTSNHSGHTHGVSGNSGDGGTHNHEPSMYALLQWNNSTWLMARRTSYVSQDGGYYSVPFSNSAPGIGMAVTYHNGAFTTHNGHSHGDGTYDADTGGSHSHTLNVAGNSSAAGNHSHTVASNGTAANAGSHNHNASAGNSNASDTGNTTPTTSASNASSGSAGSGSAFSIVPNSTYVRWLIRATGTINATASDGSDILSEAREEVVTVELVGSGTLPASQTGAAYYRVPWDATLTAVKANRNGVNTNGSVTIDVNENGTSVLSTEITIDQNESSSLTAATPAVISDSAIANDALLTFDIDSANTSDEGPLTVTLYFIRED
jgi:microcystin-dependent protein